MTRQTATSRPWPFIGLAAAIGITTIMDASGLAIFSALVLFPLIGVLWYLEGSNRTDMGFTWGALRHYGLALLHPVAVLGMAVLIALVTGGVESLAIDGRKVGLNLVLMSSTSIVMSILTEEGFFRGWLWASLRRSGRSNASALLWTSLGFSLWHWSAVVLATEFQLPAAQIPIYLVNAALLGAVWGLLRWISGSIIVASVGHGIWNGLAYTLFGFGPMSGALGAEPGIVYSPEVGWVGLILNLLFVGGLWIGWQRRRG